MQSLAGYQTTATTLVATFYQVLRNPGVFHKLRIEVRSAFATEADISGDRLLRLPLLNACIRETLRLLPPANGKTAQRTAPTCTIANTFIPAGTIVSADIYSIQRSPAYFADASSFRPERWIENGEGTLFENDNRAAYQPFLIGSRACIGRHMAQQSIRLVMARLVWRYDVEMLNREDFIWERDAASSLIYTDYVVMVRLKKVKEE